MKENVKPEKQSVIAFPEVRTKEITICDGSMNILVLACDGLWDVLKNNDVYEYIKNDLANQKKKFYENEENKDKEIDFSTYDLEKTAKSIIEYAINDKKSQDNVTTAIILFK